VTVDRDTQDWIRTDADEIAAEQGMRFDGERGEFACAWVESHCCLYEGDQAGELMRLMPYQREFMMRLFGWVWWNDEWGGWVRRFRQAAIWAAKKNGKSPFLAALGLYLLCGDGEQGQKVYSQAKNGDQAKISQRHAFNMVKQSPALSADCKLHGSTLQITHLPTNSVMMVLTGDDLRGAKSKEGLNGSAIIDEAHVVDRQMIESTKRMGISRREPLQVSGSTAGDDPSSWGYERFQYGRQVNAGERRDPHFLHVDYSAPDKVSDADIDAHLEEYGRAANPAWGHIVKPSEYRADWESSKGNPREVAKFKQHRINLWVGSTNPWLDTAGWDRGREPFSLADLSGQSCFLGLDLSRTRDMTAAVFHFPTDEPEVTRVWPLFWLPEARAKALDHLFPFRSWAAGGHLILTPGDVVDYSAVEEGIVEQVEAHGLQVRGVYFDQHYAEEITQRLADRLGCERTAVPQTLMALSPLCKELERRISVGLVRHPGNPVLAWQVGHAEVWQDRNQNIRPVKPAPNSGKSIDGVAALVDTMAGIVAEGPAEFINPTPLVI